MVRHNLNSINQQSVGQTQLEENQQSVGQTQQEKADRRSRSCTQLYTCGTSSAVPPQTTSSHPNHIFSSFLMLLTLSMSMEGQALHRLQNWEIMVMMEEEEEEVVTKLTTVKPALGPGSHWWRLPWVALQSLDPRGCAATFSQLPHPHQKKIIEIKK